VAQRYAVMTAVLAGAPTTTYPGGAAQRAASLTGFDGVTPHRARNLLLAPATALADTWARLDDRQWQTAFREERIGTIRLAAGPGRPSRPVAHHRSGLQARLSRTVTPAGSTAFERRISSSS
jgi:hypothetical protein